MTTLQINPTVAPQQHVPDVQNYNVSAQTLNGATKVTMNNHQLSDSDSELADRFEHEANQLNSQLTNQAIVGEDEKKVLFEDLYPSQKRQYLEEYWTPIITKLAKEHELACDSVAELEDSEMVFKAKAQARFVYDLKHPGIKLLHVSSDTHFNEMLKMGHLTIDGYKLVERRSLGGQTLVFGDKAVTTPTSSTLIYIPVEAGSLLDYAQSPEAKEHSQALYDADLQRLISKRKAIAVKLNNAKISAREQLAAIPTFEQIISDTVKRSAKKQ